MLSPAPASGPKTDFQTRRALRCLLLAYMLLLSGCTSMLFQPLPQHFISPDALGVMHEELYFDTKDGVTLHGWKLLADAEAQGTLLYLHGNAENISTHFANVYWLTAAGYDVYLYDYRGYGKSSGVAELDGIVQDADSMIAHTLSQLPGDAQLVVIGHSLGASLAIHAVAHSRQRSRIAALITVEAFSDYHKVTQDVLSTHWLTWLLQWPLSFTVDNSYRPLDAADQVAPVPWIIMHSLQDEIIPFYHAERLYAAAQEPKRLQQLRGGHNDVFNIEANRALLLEELEKQLITNSEK